MHTSLPYKQHSQEENTDMVMNKHTEFIPNYFFLTTRRAVHLPF